MRLKRLRRVYLATPLLTLVLIGCGTATSSTVPLTSTPAATRIGSTVTSVPLPTTDYGTTTRTIAHTDNPDAQTQFLAAYQRGEPAIWHLIAITAEGDPIVHTFTYDGNGRDLQLVIDNTRDRYAGASDKGVFAYTCTEISEQAAVPSLHLSGCFDQQGPVPDQFVP